MKCTLKNLALLGVAALGTSAIAQVTVDGSFDAAYGSPLVLQNNQTNFGDNNVADGIYANGSELNGAYAYRTWDAIYVFIPGNVETNYNRLDLFIDSRSGGENRLGNSQSDINFGGLRRMGDDGSGNGLTFDTGFDADYCIIINGGESGTGQVTFYMDLGIVGNASAVIGKNPWNRGGVYMGNFTRNAGGTSTGAGQVDLGIKLAYNNANIAGVESGAGMSSLASTGLGTGVEFKIPTGAISGSGPVRMCALINAGDHGYVSNQVLGGLGGNDNLGDPRYVNFDLFPGNQYFTVPAGTAFPTVHGTVDFNGGEKVSMFKATLLDANANELGTIVIAPDDNGNFAFQVPAAGSYTLSGAKAPKYLGDSKTFTATGTGATISLNLRPGDIDGDGSVTIFDYVELSGYFDKSYDSGNAGDWNNVPDGGITAPYESDLDGDGSITIFDYLFLSTFFDQSDN